MMDKKLQNWITSGTARPFYARKTFELSALPKQAEIAISGLGQFNLYVNGQKVSDHVLDPAWTDYKKLVDYVVFDLKPYLKTGKNVLAAEVGNGWFIMETEGGYSFHFPPFMPPNPNPYVPYSSVLILAARLELFFAGGQNLCIETDRSWKVHEHMITASNVYGSEIMDGRKRIPGWNSAEYDDSDWEQARFAMLSEIPAGAQEEQSIPAVRVIREYEGKLLGEVNGRLIYDFSQNTSGMLSLELKGQKGSEIRIYPAEKLGPDGDVDQMAKNWINIDVRETCILGEENSWEAFDMTFTYFGARFIAVEGVSSEQIRNVRLLAVTSAVEDAGTFECDDERYMKIYDLIKKAVEANMVSVHTDCPTIERFAWQEENHLMAPAIMYMKDTRLHWAKYLKDTRTAQHTAEDYFNDMEGGKYYPGEGLIPSQAPCYLPNVLPVPGLGEFYDIIGWGSSIILGTFWHYVFYGDTKIIEDNYEAAIRYLDHMKTRVNEEGFINHGLGDWGNPAGEFARENVETAFLYADAYYMAFFAGELGREDDRKGFLAYAEEVKKNYNDKLLVYNEATGHYCYKVWQHQDEIFMTQAAEAMPLFWNIVPEDKKADIVLSLREALENAGCIQSGEVGQPYIIQVAAQYGMNDLISRYIVKEQHPSYYAFVLDGETTLGEYWEQNPRSHCHDMMGHIAEWFYNGIGGILVDKAGFKEVKIRPYMPDSMNHFKVTYRSPMGLICVEADRTGHGIELKVSADERIRLTIDRSQLD